MVTIGQPGIHGTAELAAIESPFHSHANTVKLYFVSMSFGVFMHLREWARIIKRDVLALYLASRDPRVPWYAKALAIAVVAYALSPIDLIPDFIPVLGYLDDVVIVPLGIWLAIRLIPPDIMAEHREAAASLVRRPSSKLAAFVIVGIWTAAAGALIWLALGAFGDNER